MIKTVSQAIDDMAVSLGASPSAEIPTVAQALENVYTALGGTRTDLDTLVVSEVIDLVAPLIQGGGGGGGDFTIATVSINPDIINGMSLNGPLIVEFGGQERLSIGPIPIMAGSVNTFKVFIYGRGTDIFITSDQTLQGYTVSGDAEDFGEGYFNVTGDCAITFNEK